MRTIVFTIFFFIALSIQSCNPVYVMQAAYQESLILLKRKEISRITEDQNTSEIIRSKLKLILLAKSYAPKIGLQNKNAYDYYTHSSKDALTWVLMASPKTSFAFKTWWFPIVGSVPYKGYFNKQDAIKSAKKLMSEGFETSIRGADAFSTLGWFNDPIVTPFLKRPEVTLVDTVIHELVHASYWVKNQVAFNESLANFVGSQASIEFFKELQLEKPEFKEQYLQAKQNQMRQFELSTAIDSLYLVLNNLYKTKDNYSNKLIKRNILFKESTRLFPILKIFESLNNSELLQVKIYTQELSNFQKLYEKSNQNWKQFWMEISKISKLCEKDQNNDPFKLLRARI